MLLKCYMALLNKEPINMEVNKPKFKVGDVVIVIRNKNSIHHFPVSTIAKVKSLAGWRPNSITFAYDLKNLDITAEYDEQVVYEFDLIEATDAAKVLYGVSK